MATSDDRTPIEIRIHELYAERQRWLRQARADGPITYIVFKTRQFGRWLAILGMAVGLSIALNEIPSSGLLARTWQVLLATLLGVLAGYTLAALISAALWLQVRRLFRSLDKPHPQEQADGAV